MLSDITTYTYLLNLVPGPHPPKGKSLVTIECFLVVLSQQYFFDYVISAYVAGPSHPYGLCAAAA